MPNLSKRKENFTHTPAPTFFLQPFAHELPHTWAHINVTYSLNFCLQFTLTNIKRNQNFVKSTRPKLKGSSLPWWIWNWFVASGPGFWFFPIWFIPAFSWPLLKAAVLISTIWFCQHFKNRKGTYFKIWKRSSILYNNRSFQFHIAINFRGILKLWPFVYNQVV